MKSAAAAPPGLETRFTQPDGWQWQSLAIAPEPQARYGHAVPVSGEPRAAVLILPGLNEFCEKYFETARGLLARNYAVWCLDWPGQGKSGRFLANPHKRHSRGFDLDLELMDRLMRDHIVPFARARKIHTALLAHSMGGNSALRWLAGNPGLVACAGLSAPMIGIKAISFLPPAGALALTSFLGRIAGTAYAFGGSDWRADDRPGDGTGPYSSDPVRCRVHNAWCLQDPGLQSGSVTFGWLAAAAKACAALQKPGIMELVSTPCLIAMAGHEIFVRNDLIRDAAARMPHAELLDLPESRHEIFMERDEIRNRFMDRFYQLMDRTAQGGV